jgi:hypothetical protein
MIINNENDKIGNYKNVTNLFGAHQNIWSNEGVGRLFDGYFTIEKERNQELDKINYRVVEKLKNGNLKYFTSFNKNDLRPNLIKHPNDIIFLIDDKSKTLPLLSKIGLNEAKNLYISGLKKIEKNLDLVLHQNYSTPLFHNFVNPILLGFF